MKKYLKLFAVWSFMMFFASAHARNLNVVSFNLEARGANIHVLANQLEHLSREKDVDIWFFTDIQPEWTDELANAVAIGSEIEVDFIPRKGGRDNRFLIVYDKERFEVLAVDNPEIGRSFRKNTVSLVKFKERESGKSFMTLLQPYSQSNYLPTYITEDLNAWAEQLNDPVVALGHFDFEWSISKGDTFLDRKYLEMVSGDIFKWVRPITLIPTNCERRDEISDFILTSGGANNWSAHAEIIQMGLNYCVDHRKNNHDSNHRPVYASFKIN